MLNLNCRIHIMLLFLILGFSTKADESSRELVFKKYTKVTQGMHPKEAHHLAEEIFDKYKIVDLSATGLLELESWLEKVKVRLTDAVQNTGEYFAQYQISILATDKPEAFIYKFRSPGQRFYRGHVFISVGFVQKMVSALTSEGKNQNILQLTNETLTTLMNGLQGVLAHEFSHPKEDEVVKWEWRESQDQSNQSHGQADEMVTDLISMHLLKAAQLSPENTLIGLQLAFGDKPKQGHFSGRGVRGLVADHPEEKLRINVIRGGLVQLRREEGKAKINPIDYDKEKLMKDWVALISHTDLQYRVQSIAAIAKQKGESFVIRFLNEMLTEIAKTINSDHFNDSGVQAFEAYLDWFKYLDEVLKTTQSLTHDEEKALVDFFRKIKEIGGQGFRSGHYWNIPGKNSASSNYNASLVRKAQRLYRKTTVFEISALKVFLKDILKEKFWNFVYDENALNIFYLPLILPKESVNLIYEQVFLELKNKEVTDQATLLVEMIYGIVLMGGDIKLETKALEQLTVLLKSHRKLTSDIMQLLNQLFENDTDLIKCHLERILVAQKAKAPLLEAIAKLFLETLKHPEEFINELSFSQLHMKNPFLFRALQWSLEPNDFLKPFEAKYHLNTSKLLSRFLDILRSKAWQSYIKKSFENMDGTINTHTENKDAFIQSMTVFLTATYSGFSQTDRESILDEIIQVAKKTKLDSHLFRGRIRFELDILKDLSTEENAFYTKQVVKFAQFIKAKTKMDYFDYIEDLYGSKEKVIEKAFAFNGDKIVLTLKALYESHNMDQSKLFELIDRYLFQSKYDENELNHSLSTLKMGSAYWLWRTLSPSKSPKEALALLEKLKAAFSIKDTESAGQAIDVDGGQTRAARQIGQKILPDYVRFIEHIRDGLEQSLRNLIGVDSTTKTSDLIYIAAFKKHYSKVLDFLKIIFNPDNEPISIEYREMFKYQHLDDTAETFLKLIPGNAMTFEQNYEIWLLLTSKRSNRFTDGFFTAHVYPVLKTNAAGVTSEYEKILSFGRLRSEKLRNELMDTVLNFEAYSEPKNLRPANSTQSKVGSLSDQEVETIIQKIVNQIPNSSRFRDDLLEKLAWNLEFSQAQVEKFIEPLKSFNFRTLNPLTLNILSSLSVLLEKLKNNEKLDLIKYFLEPKGSIRSVLTWLTPLKEEVDRRLRNMGIKEFDWVDYLESFVRDAGEGEKLVLIELIVGSRGTGLWHQNDQIKQALYDLADLTEGSLKKKLFDFYIKVLPEYEHSVTISYLLATKGESSGSELLHILEMFDTPGMKFAQIASIMGVFGPERSAELA